MIASLPPTPAVYLLLGSFPLLVLSDTNSFLTGLGLFKIISSIAFVSGPLTLVLTESTPYRTLVTSAVIFSLIGDICLIPSRKEYYPQVPVSQGSIKKATSSKSENTDEKISVSFQLGIVAFATAHVAYILAFLEDNQKSLSWPIFTGTLTATMLLSKWLGVIYPSKSNSPSTSWMSGNVLKLSISNEMRPLVSAYALIIGSMLAVAASTTTSSPSLQNQRLLGAVMFIVSDVFVAKDAFGKKSAMKKLGKERNHWLKTTVGLGLYFWGQMILAGTVQ